MKLIKTTEKAKAALLIYTLLGVVAIGVCFITDFIANKGVTWSLYVLYTVPFLFLGMIPLCFKTKHNIMISAGILSAAVIPLLYLFDTITERSTWFYPIGLPVAVRAIISLWLCVFMLKIIRINKFYLLGILFLAFGTFISLTTTSSVSNFTGKPVPELINIICIFGIAVFSLILFIIGYILNMTKKRKQEIQAN